MSETAPTKLQVELGINEVHAVAAGLRLLIHLSNRTCVVTDKGGCPSHVRMDAIEDLAAEGGKALSKREIAALSRRVLTR